MGFKRYSVLMVETVEIELTPHQIVKKSINLAITVTRLHQVAVRNLIHRFIKRLIIKT